MGFYQDQVVPFLLHHGMRDKRISKLRQRVVPAARGRVLEIGIGSGLNLPLYGGEVSALFGIDPSEQGLARARKAVAALPFETALESCGAEALPFDDRDFDTVVTTWTLCTIPEVDKALQEMRRVLKTEGQLLFIEHGHAATTGVAAWQNRINPLWRRLAGGCNMNRPIDRLLESAGFRIERLDTGHLISGPRILTYMYEGLARPG